MMKLSVNETKWSSLLARTRALILYISICIFDFGPVKLPGLSRNGPQVFIDPTFTGIFVCGPLQSFVVNVCTFVLFCIFCLIFAIKGVPGGFGPSGGVSAYSGVSRRVYRGCSGGVPGVFLSLKKPMQSNQFGQE